MGEGRSVDPSGTQSQVAAGFQALAVGDWDGARDAFSAVLAVAEVPEALVGLANAQFWSGDIAGTIANCERAYAASRRRGDRMFAAGVAFIARGLQQRGTSATRLRPADRWHVLRASSTALFQNCAGNSWVPPRTLLMTRSRARRWHARRLRSDVRTATRTWS